MLRTYAAFLAGTNKMRWPRFPVANTVGGIAWAAIYTAAGLFAGVCSSACPSRRPGS